MRVFLIRHGETAWTITGQHTGRTDLALTEAGENEARAAARPFSRLLGERPLDAVYSSPRRRALRTAELALGTSIAPEVSDLLAEFDYGAFEGLTPSEIRERAPAWNIWQDGCPDGESIADVGARVDQFVDLLLSRHAGQTVAVVSHGHLSRILTASMLGLAPSYGRLFSIKTASIAELQRKDERFVLAAWNLTA
jgi:probable phosphoglycerate mutase